MYRQQVSKKISVSRCFETDRPAFVGSATQLSVPSFRASKWASGIGWPTLTATGACSTCQREGRPKADTGRDWGGAGASAIVRSPASRQAAINISLATAGGVDLLRALRQLTVAAS